MSNDTEELLSSIIDEALDQAGAIDCSDTEFIKAMKSWKKKIDKAIVEVSNSSDEELEDEDT